MKKNIFGILMAVSLLVLFPVITVQAKEVKIGVDEDWYVSYDGKNVSKHNIDETNMMDKIGGVQPGDTVTYQVGYHNDTDKDADWYLSTKILQSLEQSNDGTSTGASGGIYSFVLSYEINGSVTELYNSDTVGGDDKGLKGLLGSGDDTFFYVGRVASGKTGKVILSITLDGSTQNNDYMKKIASIAIRFGAQTVAGNPEEIYVPGKHHTNISYAPSNSNLTTLPNGAQLVKIPDANVPLAGLNNGPRTGDDIRLLIICGIGLLLGLTLVGYYIYLMRKNNQEA